MNGREITTPQSVPFLLSERQRRGMYTGDDGLSWFDPGDPFHNELCLMVARHGDDYCGTVFYAGMPVLLVFAGPTHDETTQYDREIPVYLEPERQEIHALFFENVVGDMPQEGETGTGRSEDWPFPHAASVMVHETRKPERPVLDAFFGERTPVERNYDLYSDLMEHSGSQGYEITDFTGAVAHSMYAAISSVEPDFPEPRGF